MALIHSSQREGAASAGGRREMRRDVAESQGTCQTVLVLKPIIYYNEAFHS